MERKMGRLLMARPFLDRESASFTELSLVNAMLLCFIVGDFETSSFCQMRNSVR